MSFKSHPLFQANDALLDSDSTDWLCPNESAFQENDADRAAAEKLTSKHSDSDLIEMFPPTDIAVGVEEDVDDLIPDYDHASLSQLNQALVMVAEGMDKCAVLKQMTGIPLFARVERELKRRIRAEKESIVRLRETIRRAIASKSTSQPRLSGSAKGFAAWGGKNHAAEIDDLRRRRKELTDESNETVQEILKGVREENHKAAQRRIKEYTERVLFNRDRYVVLKLDD